MSKHLSSNGHVNAHGKNGNSNKNKKQHNPQGNGLVIPIQKIGRHWSTNQSDDSFDSLVDENVQSGEHSPVTAFTKSFGGEHAASSLNVYSMSPRTSVLYEYYRQPKGYYESQTPLTHSSRSNGHYCTADHQKNSDHKELSRTISDCCENSLKPPSPMLSGVPLSFHNEVLEDPRRRAWSESGSRDPRKSNMHMSRMSALKKIRNRFKGNQKKKEDPPHYESLNHSNGSINSLEKPSDRYSHQRSVSPRPRSTLIDIDIDEMSSLSLHPDDANRRKSSEISPDRRRSQNCGERSRTASKDSTTYQDPELIYQRFLEEHTCYDIMPTSCKLVVFDTKLVARKAFHALISNSVRSAPLWDGDVSCYVGMLTVTDFIKVILIAHRAENMKVESIEDQSIDSWRKLLNLQTSFASVHPGDSLLHSLKVLMNEHFRGVPVMDEASGDIFHVVNHKRILRFLHLFMKELPKPSFMEKALSDLQIGTYSDITTVTKHDTMLHVLELLTEKNFSAIPVVDEHGQVMDVFCKLDMISLAAQGLYHDLSTTIEVALACRFKPLFEDEECPADTFTRFSSPRPHRRDINVNIRRKHPPGNDVTSSADRRNDFQARYGNVASRGQQGNRAPHNKSPLLHHHSAAEDVHHAHSAPHRQLSAPVDPSVPRECAGHKVRHKSLSNPLIKCRISDTLQHVIELMVSTEANLLVVIGSNSNHVVGVVTVSDILHYIVNPSGIPLDQESPTRVHRRSRHQFTSTPSHTSLDRSTSSCNDVLPSSLSLGIETELTSF